MVSGPLGCLFQGFLSISRARCFLYLLLCLCVLLAGPGLVCSAGVCSVSESLWSSFMLWAEQCYYCVEQVETGKSLGLRKQAWASLLCFARSRCPTTHLVQDLCEAAGLCSSTSLAEPGAKCRLVRAWSLPGVRSGASGSQSCGSGFCRGDPGSLFTGAFTDAGGSNVLAVKRWALVYVNGSPSQGSGGLCCTMLELLPLGQC